jgi:hypothetical protein
MLTVADSELNNASISFNIFSGRWKLGVPASLAIISVTVNA